jgi:uncharacterized protein with PIN domain
LCNAVTMVAATFRFYEELNDFLAPDRRGHEFACACARAATTKHMIEALGVPHTEVELVLVNGESVGFDRLLGDGDRVAVYPKFEAFDIAPLLRVREQPLRVTRFIADAHLGGLARLLRMSGFDTLYDNHFRDDEVERISSAENRIVLTRDRELPSGGASRTGAMCMPCDRQSSFARSLLALTWRAAPGHSRCVCTAMLLCIRSIRREWQQYCRRLCARTTSTSVSVTFASASSGRDRTGAACARCSASYWSRRNRSRGRVPHNGTQP